MEKVRGLTTANASGAPYVRNNSDGNHGEDVKEYYFYLDSTPPNSYMKYLYKYPQAAFPHEDLVTQNGQRDAPGSRRQALAGGKNSLFAKEEPKAMRKKP